MLNNIPNKITQPIDLPKDFARTYRRAFHRQKVVRPIFISSYVPQKCGIATFSKDLIEALDESKMAEPVEIIGVDNGKFNQYPPEVVFRIRRDIENDYIKATRFINNHQCANVVCVQYEYGLFGGWDGDYIFHILENISLPIISTLHTVPEIPTESQLVNMKRLAEASDFLIVMILKAKEYLIKKYNIPEEKIGVIHHGVTIVEPRKKSKTKGKKLMISGLLNKDKGIEYVLWAMPGIVNKHPKTKLLIVGQTHPAILQQEGERYRNYLKNIVTHLNLSGHVKFINKYLPLNKLMEYYNESDIFLTPHLKPEQASSGTLAYALGLGKICVSTPYLYAKEMLKDGRGILVPFENAKHIEEAVLSILENNYLENKITKKAKELGETMSWQNVSRKYFEIFQYAVAESYSQTSKESYR